jgi:hypothetical protein
LTTSWTEKNGGAPFFEVWRFDWKFVAGSHDPCRS